MKTYFTVDVAILGKISTFLELYIIFPGSYKMSYVYVIVGFWHWLPLVLWCVRINLTLILARILCQDFNFMQITS